MDLGHRVRDLRNAQHLSQIELAARAGVARNTLNRIENGHLMPTAPVIEHLAEALNVAPGVLFEEPALAGELVDGPSLGELHTAAGCRTDWLTKPEAEWQASWPPSLTPREAMRIVQEMAEEFAALKPLMAAQEVGLPIYKRAFSGRYRQAWLRFFTGMQGAHKCGVANGLIRQEDTLNDLEKVLGETPEVLENRARYEEMLTIGAA
jgi:transcriptional regulator with XRE-family HTH domain